MYVEDFDAPAGSRRHVHRTHDDESNRSSCGSSGSASCDIDEQYFSSYADLTVHRVMFDDTPRMEFYRSILQNTSRVKGRVVVDVGAGTGLLSLWAAKDGEAAFCLAVEASALASTIEALAAANGLCLEKQFSVASSRMEDIIAGGADRFLEAYPRIAELGGVDIIVSEWMGFYLVHEAMLPSVIRARDFFREVNSAICRRGLALPSPKPIVMVPSHASIYAAPANMDPWIQGHVAYWNHKVRASSSTSVDYTLIGTLEAHAKLEAANPLVDVLPHECLLSPPTRIVHWDLNTISEDETLSVREPATFRIEVGGGKGTAALHGICIWFDVLDVIDNTVPAAVLTTSPLKASTHWKQTVMLLPPAIGWQGSQIVLSEGEPLDVTIGMSCTQEEDDEGTDATTHDETDAAPNDKERLRPAARRHYHLSFELN